MPISLQCPGCRQVLTVPDAMAGQQAQCSGCRTLFIVPAPVAAVAAAPFTFGAPPGAAPAPGFSFQQPAPQDQSYKEVAGNAGGWRHTAAGLKHVWFGSAVQVASLAYLVVVRVAQAALAGQIGADGLFGDAEKKQALDILGGASSSTAIGLALAALLAGAGLRLAGWARCVLVPDLLGKVLAAAAALCEAGGLFAGASYLLAAAPKRPGADAGSGYLGLEVAGGLGLLTALLFVRQLGAVFDSRLVHRRVMSVVVWVVAGPAVMFGALYATAAVRWYFGRDANLGPTVGWAALAVNGLVLVGVPVLMLLKYLGLITLARQEVGRRVGRG